MAFNPTPEVAAARDFARKFNKQQVIILSLDNDTLSVATYGETVQLCAETKTLGDRCYDAVFSYFV
jgi:hypothetical protein